MKKQLIFMLLALASTTQLFARSMHPNTLKNGYAKTVFADARTLPTLYIKTVNGQIAYRTFGKGAPMIICNRFRGTLDTWDPEFLNQLAKKNRIIIFDYPGIGLSTGSLPHKIIDVAAFVDTIAASLKLERFNLAGWSYGGAVAQTYAANFPTKVNSLILIGANPPGKNDTPIEQAFLDAAFKPVNDLADEVILFFEPTSPASVQAAKVSHNRIASRTKDLSKPVTPEKFQDYFKGVADYREDSYSSRTKLATVPFQVFILSGDHDPSCPVENWYPLIKQWKTSQLHVIANSGHGVQHEFPEYSVALINLFLGGK